MFDPLNRRKFLKAIIAVAASTQFACSDDKDDGDPTPVDTTPLDPTKFYPQSVCSGDPRPDSVVLWVRAVDPSKPNLDMKVRLEVSTSAEFGTLFLDETFTALAEHDHALKVKVTNLTARTTYYYRFTIEKDGKKATSNVGRTKTAPAAGDDVPVKLVFASCQDYLGRYYNSWQRLLQLNEDLDFVVFLGDYIYETTGDKSFQTANPDRKVTFSDPSTSLTIGSGDSAYGAANSLSNYRDIYKQFRTDRVLQQVHERYPFIVMWDDHEFSDDCWGDHATYTDGRVNEEQLDRRRNAELAFYEYIPLDNTQAAEGAIDAGAAAVFPDTQVYRDFEFGKNLKLLVLDLRTYRPDHLIPEDAYPGTVVIDAATLATLPPVIQAAFSGDTFAYVDLDNTAYSQQRAVLGGAYVQLAVQAGLTQAQAQAKADALVKGKVSLFYANQVLQAAGVGALAIPVAGTPRGLAYVHLGKAGLFGIQGTRYIVVKPALDLYASIRYAATAKASENVLGTAQQGWFENTVKASNTWKVVVSSVSLTSMVVDLTAQADIPDPSLRQAFYFSVDQWDGFPTKKQELLKYLRDSSVQNALFISGDIHASFASVESGIPALTAPAISSGSIQSLAGAAVVSAGFGTDTAVYQHVVTELEQSISAANPNIKFANVDAHGFVVLELKSNEALATFHLVPSVEVTTDYSKQADAALAAKFTSRTFRVQNGTIAAV